MQIGVLGSGDVGKVLAAGFMRHGHTVTVGSRTPGKLAEWAAKNRGAQVGTLARAAEFGELLVLAVKGTAAFEVLRLAGAKNLAGKAVIDACNPIADDAPVNGVLKFYTNYDESLMEQLQREFSARYRAAVYFVVHPRLPAQRMDPRVQDAEEMNLPVSRWFLAQRILSSSAYLTP